MKHSHQALTPSRRQANVAHSLHTEPTSVEQRFTRAAQVFLLCVATWLVVLGLFNLRHPSDWAMGDWLINYTGGFVRRGLTGQLALVLRTAHIPLLWTILLLQWSLYFVVLLRVWRLISDLRWNWWQLVLLFSPATLAFVLLDPPFAFRKDILFFALLALTLSLGNRRSAEQTRTSSWIVPSLLLTAGCTICILSHEGLIVFFPYLFAALFLRTRNVRRSVQFIALPALVSAALFALVSRFPGDIQIAATVCRSIGGALTSPPSGICGGAVDYLAHDAAYAHHEVVRVMLAGHYWRHVPWLFLLPLVPVILGVAQLWRRDRSAARILLAMAGLAWLMSISVFFYGTDFLVLQLLQQLGRNGQQIAARKLFNLTDVAEAGAHNLRLVSELLVVVVDLRNGVNPGILFRRVVLARIVLIPVQDATDERRDKRHLCFGAGNSLVQAEQQRQVAVNALFF